MAGFIGEDQVRRIKESVDLVQLMGEYTNLKKSGSNFSCCCPFHQERTPSMHVYADQQTYHCFGCQKHGDVITLIREKEHLDFNDAMEVLARRAGIEIKYERGGAQMPRSEREQFVAAMEFAVRFYEDALWRKPEGREALQYLTSRGLSDDVIRRFRLGWSIGNGTLIEEARRRKIDVQHLVKNDLAIDRNGRWVDRFFERVMFPICDRFGNPIAFSGRLLPAAEKAAKEAGRGVGKYVNSTDTPLYHKSNAVFNLHRARAVCREKGRLIVMEGPTDVMAADDAGFGECVAVLGTALTPEHAKQMGSLVGHGGRLLLLFDGDRAGQTNSLKAVRTCLSVGVPSWVAVIPNEMDPAELLKEDPNGGGRAAFEQVLAVARADVDHLLRNLAPRPYELDHRALLAVVDQILECLRPLKDPELVSLYLRDISSYLNFDQQRLQRRLAGGGDATATEAQGRIELAEPLQAILHILVQRPDLRAKAFDQLELEPSFFPEPWRLLADHLMVAPQADHHALLALPELEQHAGVREAVFRWASTPLGDGVEPESLLGESILNQCVERLRDEAKRLELAEKEAEKNKDFASADRLSADRLNLTRRIKDLIGQSGLTTR